MEVDRSGRVIIPREDIDTFRDGRLPLHERMARLAVFIQSDSWFGQNGAHAARLILEGADRLRSLRVEDEERLRMFRNMDQKTHELEAELSALRKRYTEETYKLQQEVKRLNESNE